MRFGKRSPLRVPSRKALGLLAPMLTLTGCMAQATHEWPIHSPDAAPRVTRIQVGNDLVNRGVVLRGDMDVVTLPEETTVRSGGIGAGYGWSDVAPNDCIAVGMMFGGRIDIGRPAMTEPSHFGAGLTSRAEISFTTPKDRKNEKLTLVALRTAVVIGVETTTWTRLDARFFDASAGIGLRFGIISEGGPPIMKWLTGLL